LIREAQGYLMEEHPDVTGVKGALLDGRALCEKELR
jgi:hypothetical protein